MANVAMLDMTAMADASSAAADTRQDSGDAGLFTRVLEKTMGNQGGQTQGARKDSKRSSGDGVLTEQEQAELETALLLASVGIPVTVQELQTAAELVTGDVAENQTGMSPAVTLAAEQAEPMTDTAFVQTVTGLLEESGREFRAELGAAAKSSVETPEAVLSGPPLDKTEGKSAAVVGTEQKGSLTQSATVQTASAAQDAPEHIDQIPAVGSQAAAQSQISTGTAEAPAVSTETAVTAAQTAVASENRPAHSAEKMVEAQGNLTEQFQAVAETTEEQTAVKATSDAQGNAADTGESEAGLSQQEPEAATEVGETASAQSAVGQTSSLEQGGKAGETEELTQAVDTALDRFALDFKGVESDGKTVQIALDPDELGSLLITLTATENGIKARIQTDNAQAANLIGEQTQRLLQRMEEKGVRVEELDVVYSQMNQQSFDQQSGQNAQQESGRGQNLYFQRTELVEVDRAEAVNTYESTAGSYAAEDGVGQSVEYRI